MLKRKALEGIASYEYKPGTYTYLDNQLNVFWTAAVEYLPKWMAPNLVTLIGTLVMAATTALELYFAPRFDQPCPRAIYFLSGLGIFFYQTMDAIDGKQARRTGSSSPLGQLFDHGCDALSSMFIVLGACATVQSGAGLRPFIALSTLSISFFLAQWEEYHTGVMSCGNGFYGVTEGQLSVVLIHFATTIIGPDMWTASLFSLPKNQVTSFMQLDEFTLSDVLIIALICSNLSLAFGNVYNVWTTPRDSIPKKDLGHKHVAKPLAMGQIIPILLILCMGVAWIEGPDKEDYQTYPIVYLVVIGIGYVYFSTRMIVSHMCKIAYSPQARVIFPFGFLIFNAYGPALGLLEEPLVNRLFASACHMVFIVSVYFYFVSNVIIDICDYLDIYCFKVKDAEKKKE